MGIYIEIATVILFVVTYLFIIKYYSNKARIVGISIAALLILNILTPDEAFGYINWNVLGVYFGMLFMIEAFAYSKVPDFIAVKIVNKAKYVSTVLLLIAVASGIISIALQNVAVVLIIAPIALSITRKLKISPVQVLIAVAISANLQGVATLIGDTPSMLFAAFAKFTFNDFFFYGGKPSLFFAVQVGAIASIGVLYFFFRKFNHCHSKFSVPRPKSFFPAWLLIAMVAALSFSSFLDPDFRYLAGLICLGFGAASLLWYRSHDKKGTIPMLMRLDWETGFFLAGIFILVGSLIKVGVIDDIANLVSSLTGQSLLFTFIVIVSLSLLLTAFIDNIPYIAAMLPVVQKIAVTGGFNPTVLYFGLVIAACVGGNITPIGASANIVAMGIAKKEGYETTFYGFVKEGLPFTLVSVAASCLFVYLLFA